MDRSNHYESIGATTVGTGEPNPPTFRLGTNNLLVPHNFLAMVFKKQEISRPREPTNKLSSHHSAGFSIRVFFLNLPGVITPDPHIRRGHPLPALNTQPATMLRPKPSLQLFSRGCAPVLKTLV